MATYTWRASSGAFDTASNWDPAVVPITGDTALFNTNPGAITGTGSVDSIVFSGGGWSIGGQLLANSANIANGGVTINGATAQLVLTSAFTVAGGAGLSLANGGVLSVTQGGSASFVDASLAINSGGVGNFNGALRLGAGGSTNAVLDAALLTVGGVFSLGTYGVGNLTVQNGAQAVINAARDDNSNYLQLGVVNGSGSTVQVKGSGSLLLLSQDSAGIGIGGFGELDVIAGGSARFNSGNNSLNPALVLGVLQSASATVVVSGAGSTLVSGGSIIVGKAGSAAMTVNGGASVTSKGLTSTQAALAVAAASGSASLSISGAGTQFVGSGTAVIGGDNRGSGLLTGGAGVVSVTGGGLLQTYGMTILAGSRISIDSASQENIVGDLALFGALSNAGTLAVSGTVSGPGTLTLAGGFANVGALAQTQVAFSGTNTTLRVGALYGTSTVTGMQSGDKIDLAGTTATINGNTVNTSTGSLSLSGSGPYSLISDGNGGTFVAPGSATVGVFRFFDSNYGTHFFSSSLSEKNTIITSRPDLVYEGVGLESVDPAANDPNASPVYRFFDTAYGTHFFTASTAERDTVIANRPDLLYEGTGFVEHTVQQPGDVGVYRFFDTRFGTHFYTADASERATIIGTRPDLIDEGIGFYAPTG